MGIDNPVHLIFIAAVALIVLGPKRLPDLARSLGHGMREFRESLSEASSEASSGGSSGGDAHVNAPLVPQQAQLVAASEPEPASPADAVVVDPAAPASAVHEASPLDPTSVHTAGPEAVEQPWSPSPS
jgi:TatA/E family protein of Tat protein translocase